MIRIRKKQPPRQKRETSAELIRKWEKEKGRKAGLSPEEIRSWEEYNKKHKLPKNNRYPKHAIRNKKRMDIKDEN